MGPSNTIRKRVQIALCVFLVVVAGMVAERLLRPQQHEPVYQSKRLSVWLRNYSGTAELTNAVRQIGTNGIPTLLKMLRQRNSPSIRKLIDFWDRRIARLRYLPAFVTYPDWYLNDANHVNDAALRGFKILGADARSAVPNLVNIYEQHDSPFLADNASIALIAVAPEDAIPILVRDTSSSNQTIRLGAIMALDYVTAEPGLVVPTLAKLLSDSNINVRFVAARGLQHFGTNAPEAVPALVLALEDPISGIRAAATNTLKAVDIEAAAKAGVK